LGFSLECNVEVVAKATTAKKRYFLAPNNIQLSIFSSLFGYFCSLCPVLGGWGV